MLGALEHKGITQAAVVSCFGGRWLRVRQTSGSGLARFECAVVGRVDAHAHHSCVERRAKEDGIDAVDCDAFSPHLDWSVQHEEANDYKGEEVPG